MLLENVDVCLGDSSKLAPLTPQALTAMPPKGQQILLSRFFKPTDPSSTVSANVQSKKRPSSTIDLTLDEDDGDQNHTPLVPVAAPDARPSKKTRVSSTFSDEANDSAVLTFQDSKSRVRVHDASAGAPGITVTLPSAKKEIVRAGEAQRKWALGSTSELVPLTPEELEARKTRRDAYATKLSIHFDSKNKRRWDVENADTAALIESQEEDMPETRVDGDNLEDNEDEESAQKSRTTSKSSKKAISTKGKGKAKSDIGPSGQTWTPLEKQVNAM